MTNNIRRLTFAANEQALELLQLQMAAYRVEAGLIGFDDIPPLKDSISSIQQSKETFFGYYVGKTLAGAISCESEGDEVTICRMMVYPEYFRKGIASALLRHVFASVPAAGSRYTVSTGALNTPALNLYGNHGFREQSRREIAAGIELVTLTKYQ